MTNLDYIDIKVKHGIDVNNEIKEYIFLYNERLLYFAGYIMRF